MSIIEVRNISKTYPVRRGSRALLGRGGLRALLGGRQPDSGHEALSDISLDVAPGQSLGIIGRNGSGKSTLLKILAGVTLPSSGTVTIRGRVASLLELGAGFHPMLTGRENVYLNAGLLGMRHRQVDEVFHSIVAFSGIGAFIDQPVDTYSSGMYVRIAFSVAVHTNPDIFLVDEVLAVGDEEFQRRCRVKIGELKEAGKTIVFVSHDLGIVHSLCDQIALLSRGRMVVRETPQATIDYYLRQVGQERGIHTMREGDQEAIFSHGRLSLFRGGREITSPAGIRMNIDSLGHYHDSASSEWRVTEQSASSCTAETELSRLPLRLRWRVLLENGRVVLSTEVEVLSPVHVDTVLLLAFFPWQYSRWILGEKSAEFPPVQPGHTEWDHIAPYDPNAREVLLSSADQAQNIRVELIGPPPGTGFVLLNSEYTSGSRILQVLRTFPKTEQPVAPGRYEMGTIAIETGLDVAGFLAWQTQQDAARSRTAGGLTGQLHPGHVTLSTPEGALSAGSHVHTQIFSAGMWLHSNYMQWTQITDEGVSISARGTTARLPFAQVWRMETAPAGLRLQIAIECDRPVTIEEYNVSLMLPDEFKTWKTDHEAGEFPPIAPDEQAWLHVNTQFAPGRRLEASSGTRTIHWALADTSPELRPAVLNTGAHQAARVLQFIRMPGQEGPLQFTAGTHEIFAGVLSVGADA